MKTASKLILLLSVLSLPYFTQADDKGLVMEHGKTKYVLCGACHGMDGKGMQPSPGVLMAAPYTESEIVKGEPEFMALIIMKGLQKEDAKYLGIMAPLEAALNDKDLAAVITYVRNTFGGQDDVVTEAQAAEWRAKYKHITAPMARAEVQKLIDAAGK